MVALKPFADSSDVLRQPAALRDRMRVDGYLFVQGLLPADAVGEVGADSMRLCR